MHPGQVGASDLVLLLDKSQLIWPSSIRARQVIFDFLGPLARIRDGHAKLCKIARVCVQDLPGGRMGVY